MWWNHTDMTRMDYTVFTPELYPLWNFRAKDVMKEINMNRNHSLIMTLL